MTLSCLAIVYSCGALLVSSEKVALASGSPGTETKCKGDDFVLDEPHPEVAGHHVFVFRNGVSVASTSVQAYGDLQGRLQVDADSMVTLKNLSSNDFGTYRVELKLSDGARTERTVRLVVGEPPETIDGKLMAMHDFSNDTLVRLKCGTFKSLGYPPVSVSWKDPRGQTLSSTGFFELSFTLDLPVNIAVPGKYCCQLDCRDPNYCCLDNQSPLRQCAQVDVQTDKTVPEVKHRREDSVSLASFISLAQQVSAVDVIVRELNFSSLLQRVADIDVTVRELERARTGQDCSESGVSAMAQLVHRQAKCDQLDAYMDRVDAIEESFQRNLSDIRGFAKAIQSQTENGNHTMVDFQSRIAGDIGRVNQSLNMYYFQSDSKTTDINVTLQTTLLTLVQMDERMSRMEVAISNLTDKMVKVEKWTVGCPVHKGYTLFNQHCLKLFTMNLSYTDARRRCEEDGAHLFHFKSRDLDGPPVMSFNSSTGVSLANGFWIGADDLVTQGHFLWSDGTPLPSDSTLWDVGQPNNYMGIQDCLALFLKPYGLHVNDLICHHSQPFMCQAGLN